MRDAVVCLPLRTPIGKYGGIFADLPAARLAAGLVRAIVERGGFDPGTVDDVILGQCYPNGEAPAIGRVAALDAGLPTTVPGLQLDRRCGSGLQSVCDAAMRIQTGAADLVVAGGVESMSQAEHYTLDLRRGRRSGDGQLMDRLGRGRVTAGGQLHPVAGGMLETAENVRAAYDIGRREQDELALLSHQRAVAAQDDGRFREEIVPVTVDGKGGPVTHESDEHPRRDATMERLAGLTAIRQAVDPEATVTAGNASGQNDAAAACLVTTPEEADRLNLVPLARLRSWAVAGVDPEMMGMGPVPAAKTALNRAGMTLRDMDLIELNEAFAAQVLGVLRAWNFDDLDRLNVNGSGISLGHPVGATGARMLVTLLHEMVRRDTAVGLATMCIGGGQGLAAVFERIAD